MRIDTALATYQFLVALARADGSISSEEKEILERYRRALKISPRKARGAQRSRESIETALRQIRGSPIERAHVLKMMSRR